MDRRLPASASASILLPCVSLTIKTRKSNASLKTSAAATAVAAAICHIFADVSPYLPIGPKLSNSRWYATVNALQLSVTFRSVDGGITLESNLRRDKTRRNQTAFRH